MGHPFQPQWVKGVTSRQAHANLPPGTVEEEHGREGFYGPASHLYRLHPPTSWVSIDGPLLPHLLDTQTLGEAACQDLPLVILENAELQVGYWERPKGRPDWFFREATGDLLYFVHAGDGVLETEYGPLRYGPGDYLLVPRGTTHCFDAATDTALFTLLAVGDSIALPDRGLLGRHAIFDEAILETPEPDPHDEVGTFEVRVHRGGELTSLIYPNHPLDVVGWKGDLAPLRLNVDDIRPAMAPRYHLPPSVHTTFVGNNFVVVTFTPRPVENDPSIPHVPAYHRNIDYDELTFLHRGQAVSRVGIRPGMITFHPAGIHHGPNPTAVSRSKTRDPYAIIEDVRINVDTRNPLALTEAGRQISVEGYSDSWRTPAVT